MTEKIIGTIGEYLKGLSSNDFLAFGKPHIGYIKPVMMEEEEAFAIHAADGTFLAFEDSEEQALDFVRQNELEPIIIQ